MVERPNSFMNMDEVVPLEVNIDLENKLSLNAY